MDDIFTSGSGLMDSLGTNCGASGFKKEDEMCLEDLRLAPATTLSEERGVVAALAPTGEWETSLLLARPAPTNLPLEEKRCHNVPASAPLIARPVPTNLSPATLAGWEASLLIARPAPTTIPCFWSAAKTIWL